VTAVGEVREAAAASGLLPGAKPVLVLLSGGRDSVCLLDVAVERLGPELVAGLHVNYGLREEAGEDEAFCRTLARKLGVGLEVQRIRRATGATGNVQAWARDVRYSAGARMARELGASLATAHTASDQAETILYRLAASPGRRALLGMAATDGLLVRPLLEVTRAQTTAYCEERGLTWRDDPSNESPLYTRARVRSGLLPELSAIHPAAEANVLRTAQLLREEAAVLDEVVEQVLGGRQGIELPRLAALPRAIARLVLRRLAEDAVGHLVPRAAARTEEVLALGDDGALDLGDGARAIVRGGMLSAEPTPPLPDRATTS
jgi:tRNA(Ile)-lysidine synthase